jgi:DNA polymerase I
VEIFPYPLPTKLVSHGGEKKNYQTLTDVTCQYTIVDNGENLNRLLKHLDSTSEFTFDTETDGTETGDALTIHSLQLVGISFAFSPGIAFYVPIPENNAEAIRAVSVFKPYFENPQIGKVGHNLKFDINVLRRYGIVVNGATFDTMVASYLINPENKHGLKELSRRYLNYQQIEITELIGAGKSQVSLRNLPIHEVGTYACEDADQTLILKEEFCKKYPRRFKEKLFTEIELPLSQVLADMEYQGVNINTEYLNSVRREADELISELSHQIYKIAGKIFNISSPHDIRDLLFNLGLESGVSTKKGEVSTGKDALKLLKNAHPIVPLLLEYKQIKSITSNFLEALVKQVHPLTKKLHTSFNQVRTATGRLSSSKPNLQNIPKRSELGKKVRKAFVPSSDQHLIVAADYSQIELRVMAHLSKDKSLIDAFNKGLDVHVATAAKIFRVQEINIAKSDRRRDIAKTINFGLIYMMSARGLADSISDATGEQVDEETAQAYINTYFDEFSGVKQFQDDAIYEAATKGYAETLFGRRRYFIEHTPNGLLNSKSKRQAVNTPIQGTAADIIKKAMIEIHSALKDGGFKTKMILQVHDELVFDVPKGELNTVMPLIRSTMEACVSLDVPLVVDINYGENWLEAH